MPVIRHSFPRRNKPLYGAFVVSRDPKMNHLTAFSLSCLFWALFVWAHPAGAASSQYMNTPERYTQSPGQNLAGSGAQPYVALCQGHYRLIAGFESEEAASKDFEAFVAGGEGMAQEEWYVEMVRAMIKAYFAGDHEGAYKGCLQKALENNGQGA